jgi:hypothetical protein
MVPDQGEMTEMDRTRENKMHGLFIFSIFDFPDEKNGFKKSFFAKKKKMELFLTSLISRFPGTAKLDGQRPRGHINITRGHINITRGQAF